MSAARLALASASPRRLQLLAQIGVAPDAVLPAEIDEAPQPKEAPARYVERLALAKAAALVGWDGLRLGADTAVAVGRRILPKAESLQEAEACLSLLSGRAHRVYTAVAVSDGLAARSRLVETRVWFKRLSREELQAYLAGEEWRGKAGGYAIQGRAGRFVTRIAGSYSAVVGLPLYEAACLLQSFGYSIEVPLPP